MTHRAAEPAPARVRRASALMPNGKCRIHGGLSPGAPRGKANGSYHDGYWTQEAVEERKFIRSLVKGTLGHKP